MWILGEYIERAEEIIQAQDVVRHAIGGEVGESNEMDISPTSVGSGAKISQRPKILADGTYATETAITDSTVVKVSETTFAPIRTLLNQGDFYIACVIATTFVKLSMKYASIASKEKAHIYSGKSMLLMTTMIRIGKSLTPPLDEDAFTRIMTCIRVLGNYPSHQEIAKTFTVESRKAFTHLIESKDAIKEKEKPQATTPVEGLINFRLLNPKKQLVDAVKVY